MDGTKRRFLILAKTYPTPQRDLHKAETVCTGALGEDGRFYRLYPVPFRLLSHAQQYKKFEWIEADVELNPSDARPESLSPRRSSLRATGVVEKNNVEKARLLLPHLSDSLPERGSNKTIQLVRILNPSLRWTRNDAHQRHIDVQSGYDSLLFDDKDIQALKQLYIPENLLSLKWEDASGGRHEHRIYEWEYYKRLSDLILKERMDPRAAETQLMQEALDKRVKDQGAGLWGFFGTTRDHGTWILGSLFSFKKSDVDKAASPRLFES